MVKRCSKCILPETIPNMTFDENGVCHYCNQYTQKKKSMEINKTENARKLEQLISEARMQRLRGKAKYDVLVPLSGGRDSSYVVYELAVKKDLKVLCVNYDNPFSSKQAILNIDHIVNKLNLDLVTFRWPKNRHEKSFGNILKSWLIRPDLGSMSLFCLACKPMDLMFYRIARRNNIPLIIGGSNPNEATQFKIEAREGTGNIGTSFIKSIFKMAKKVGSNYRYVKPCNLIPTVHTIMSLNGHTPYLRKKYPTITKDGYFWAYPYNESKINKTLKEIGWETSSDNKSPWRFDCEIDSVKNYLFKRLVGATEKDDLFSKNIREGLMSREKALCRLEEGDVNTEIVERVLNKVGIKLSELEGVERRAF